MRLGYVIAGLLLGVAVAAVALRGDGSSAPQVVPPAHAAAIERAVRGGRVVSNVSGVADGQAARLLRLRDMGSFTARCQGARLSVVFRAANTSTVDAVVAAPGARPRAASLNTGQTLDSGPSDADAALQTWQLRRHVKDEVHVATVTFASSPLVGGDGACLVSVEAVVQQRPRQNSVGVSD